MWGDDPLGTFAGISGTTVKGAEMANHVAYDMLSRLIERRASTREEATAQRHLATCRRCRSEMQWLQRIRVLPRRPTSLEPGRVEASAGDS
jgi:hypothetical protein